MVLSIARLASVSALAIALMAGAALAEGEDSGATEDDVVIEIVDVPEDGELIDPICIECSGEGDWTGEDEGSGGDEGWVDEGEVVIGDDGEVVIYEYLEDRADDMGEGDGSDGDGDQPVEWVDGEPVYYPTSDCGGCEAWHDGGPVVTEAEDGRFISQSYRDALCATTHFRSVAACAEAATR